MENTPRIKAIITGATGMVGRGILLECLESEDVEKVLVVGRKSVEMEHPKLTEIIHKDFLDLGPIRDRLKGYNACFFSLGISSMGMGEEEYTRITHDIATNFARVLLEQNPDMVFNYVSGSGTDGSEKSRMMWARVKGRTENAILNMGFKDAYMFRPGAILPEKGVKSATGWTNALLVLTRPLFPVFRKMKSVTNTIDIGLAMINSLRFPRELKHLENGDIRELAHK